MKGQHNISKVLSTLVFYFVVKELTHKKKFEINQSDWTEDLNKDMAPSADNKIQALDLARARLQSNICHLLYSLLFYSLR